VNRKLNRVLDEIQKTEKKIAEWQEHLSGLNVQREQLENEEIIRSIRAMKLGSRELLAVLERMQNGTLDFKQKDAEPKQGAAHSPVPTYGAENQDRSPEQAGKENENR
jgi:hypothetical protein